MSQRVVNLPLDNTVKLESSDLGLCISSQASWEAYPPYHPEDQPEFKQSTKLRSANEGTQCTSRLGSKSS